MSDFPKFAKLVHERWLMLSKHELFTSLLTTDEVWAEYLQSFPPGSNPIFREKTEHDCACCRHYIKNIGNVVAIIDGKITSVWGVQNAEHPYSEVSAHMNTMLISAGIRSVFRTKERKYGAEKTRSDGGNGTVNTWHHYHGAIDPKHYSAKPDEARGAINTTFQVFERGTQEITLEAVDTVLDLIASKALYRGEEHERAVKAFRPFVAKTPSRAALWANVHQPVARLRNTVIGTLLMDLSTGVDPDQAVKSFETKVAPMNYKRPTALITKGMVEQAMKTINELGLEPALERRFAKLSDISVNNVLWVDGEARKSMKRGGVAKLLMDEVVTKQVLDETKVPKIGVEDFMSKIVPTAKAMDVFIKNAQQGKFVSLTAPVNAYPQHLFRWNNDFGWAYDGNVTDSIKEKVKRAGGNVTSAKLRVSLAWYNLDDLDIHCEGPGGHIYFGNKMGVLDVDMNAGSGNTREPVENLSWTTLRDGVYKIYVHQYCRRETINVGFDLEVECAGSVRTFNYKNAVADAVKCFDITIRGGVITDFWVAPGIEGGGISSEKWGVKTETYTPVTTLMYSPNHWDGHKVGNRHWFFMLKGCVNPEPARGIFNEFLHSDLEKHRKVFEVLGNKTKCPATDDQLSGVGFSSTLGDELIVRVTDAKSTRQYNIQF